MSAWWFAWVTFAWIFWKCFLSSSVVLWRTRMLMLFRTDLCSLRIALVSNLTSDCCTSYSKHCWFGLKGKVQKLSNLVNLKPIFDPLLRFFFKSRKASLVFCWSVSHLIFRKINSCVNCILVVFELKFILTHCYILMIFPNVHSERWSQWTELVQFLSLI